MHVPMHSSLNSNVQVTLLVADPTVGPKNCTIFKISPHQTLIVGCSPRKVGIVILIGNFLI